jgi:pimeloyl-ACP methyl ester carboxylesterase
MKQETPQVEYESKFVDVGGTRVHYLHAGSGRPMLLIHGLVGYSGNWRNNIAALAKDASVYAIDLVNMGKSARVEGLDASLKGTAARIAAILDALGVVDADLVGHSHGGAVALTFAAMYPGRVRRLILFAPANPYSRSSDMMVRVYSTPWGVVLGRMLPYLPSPVQRMALGEMYGGPDRVTDRCLQEIVEGLRSPGTLPHVLSIIRGWFGEMARLKKTLSRVPRVPTLLVWGNNDCTVSLASGLRLKRTLRGSQLIVVRDGGHTIFEERPEEANRIMLAWLARHPVTAQRVGLRYVRSKREMAGSAKAMRRLPTGAAMRHLPQRI